MVEVTDEEMNNQQRFGNASLADQDTVFCLEPGAGGILTQQAHLSLYRTYIVVSHNLWQNLATPSLQEQLNRAPPP